MEIKATLSILDKSKAQFRGEKVGEKITYGEPKPIYEVNVSVERGTWENAGSPSSVTVIL